LLARELLVLFPARVEQGRDITFPIAGQQSGAVELS
jgi:hypothetical protein